MKNSFDNNNREECLHIAVDEGNFDEVKNLLQSGYSLDAFDDLDYTPFHYACKNEDYEMMDMLLENGANINAYNESKIGETPLGLVAATCSFELARYLIDKGADPTIKGWMQITALNTASKRKKAEGKRVYELLMRSCK